MINIEDYSRLMQLIGNIEGCAVGMDSTSADYLVDSAADLATVLEKYSPMAERQSCAKGYPPENIPRLEGYCFNTGGNVLTISKYLDKTYTEMKKCAEIDFNLIDREALAMLLTEGLTFISFPISGAEDAE